MTDRLDLDLPVRNTVFAGAGEMAAALRSIDWSRSALGPVAQWPQSLKTVVRLMLDSRYAMWLAWGPDSSFFCNDAYRPTLGKKRGFLGSPARKVWAEIWPDIGPRIEHVLRTGEATWDQGLQLFLERSGFTEETYHSFSYSPVHDDDGTVAGTLCVVSEDTERSLGERRLATLAALSNATLGAHSAAAACARAAAALAANPHDLPFVLIYLLSDDARSAVRAAHAGLAADSPAAPERVSLIGGDGDDDRHRNDPSPWAFAEVLASSAPHECDLRGAALHAGPWPEPIALAVTLPLARAGQSERLAGFMVVGLSTRSTHGENYLRFVMLIGTQVANAISDARAFDEEKQRAEALAELDRAKTAFFSNVSHELRTPLTLMLGPIADLLAEPGGMEPDARGLLTMAERNGRRLQRLVNTLLDFSRVEAGRVQVHREPLDLAALTADLAGMFRPATERAGLRLVIDCPALSAPAYADRELWEKIVLNLLSNALKFTFNGELRVSLREVQGSALLCVSDTGTGIPEASQARVFERFYRVEGAHGRTHEGSGIGLALVRELARLHGGEATVESQLGVGSRFCVRVPLGRAQLADERVGPARHTGAAEHDVEVYLGEAQSWLRDTGWSGLDVLSEAPQRAAAPLPDGGADATDRATVLVVDDNADMRGYLARLLGRTYRVVAAANGAAALEAVRAEPPDLVVSDVMMPGLDGFALLRALRDEPATASLPVILLSARVDEEARIEGLSGGADDYLTKPFNARELLARVAGTLALARARQDTAHRERALRAETENVLESITEGFLATDPRWAPSYVNSAAERMLRKGRSALLGHSIWDSFPGLVGSPFEAPFRRAMTERVAVRVDAPFEPLGTWLEVNVYPVAGGGLAFYFRDVLQNRLLEQAQRRMLEEQRFLLDLNLSTQTLVDPEEVMAEIARRLCEHLGADRCAYGEVEPDQDHVLITADHTRVAGSMVGRWRLSSFGARMLQGLRGNQPMVVHDALADASIADRVDTYRAAGVAALICVPLHERGCLVAGMTVQQSRPRRWLDADVELVRTVALRCWEATERARAVRSLGASEARFRGLSESMPHVVFSVRPDGGIAWMNRYGREFHGIDGAFSEERRYALFHPAERARTRAAWAHALASGEPYSNEVRMRRADGSWRWMMSRALPLCDEAGRIVEWIGSSVDIDELRGARQTLEDADRRKDEFIATLAHELRNPLAPLRNAVHILKVAPTPDTVVRVQPLMQRQIEHLVRLVDDLLDVSRISGGKVELQRTPLALAQVLGSAVETSRPLLEAAGHTLEQELPDEPLVVDGDAVRLAQVFANLLNNAAKYTDPGGHVVLTARRQGTRARVSVRDNGIGLTAPMLPRVFDLFTQVDPANARGQGGLGIGLSLVRSLVDLHGGSTEAHSAGPGCGSEFVVWLPLACAQNEHRVEGAGAANLASSHDAAPRAPQKVLIVDDNRDAAESLGVLLEFLGASVRVVNDGPAALAELATQRPAVVLLDIGMPGMDGYEVARRMRALPDGQALTLIALTGWGQDQDRARTRLAGFDHHMVKPADIDALSALLQAAEAKRGPPQ